MLAIALRDNATHRWRDKTPFSAIADMKRWRDNATHRWRDHATHRWRDR